MHNIGELNKISCVIKVKGRLDRKWEELFDGMEITTADNCTTISGTVTDQSAFHGLLNTVRDLGLKLIAVEQKG
jgi:hypothetical protein